MTSRVSVSIPSSIQSLRLNFASIALDTARTTLFGLTSSRIFVLYRRHPARCTASQAASSPTPTINTKVHALAGRAGLRDGRDDDTGCAGRVGGAMRHPVDLPKGYHARTRGAELIEVSHVPSRAAPRNLA